jgi:CheY-like chemotaxis protein
MKLPGQDADLSSSSRITTTQRWPLIRAGLTSSSGDDEGLLDFLTEDDDALSPGDELNPWKILVVDDDATVHATTELALAGVRIGERPLQLMHAYSAAEGRALLVNTHDVALVLLDVVMETQDAGLVLARAIREELARHDLRIILRTGQPGYAPEPEVRRHYAIDGYATKDSLTRTLLISAISDALLGPPRGVISN